MPRQRGGKPPTPLPMPTFGTPADGRKCPSCGLWFHRSHFWRSNTKSYVQRCSSCTGTFRQRRFANTGNSGMPQPETPQRRRFIKPWSRDDRLVPPPARDEPGTSASTTRTHQPIKEEQ